MGIFSRRQQPQCSICTEELPTGPALGEHLLSHVQEGSVGFSWSCPCGDTQQAWTKDIKAASALQIHQVMAHGVPSPGTASLAAALQLSDGYEGHG